LSISDEYVTPSLKEIVRNEKRFYEALKTWNSYRKWDENRNPKRKVLEAEFGYDVKHAMQLVRLARQSKEILTDKHIHVYRHDRDELKDIRNGKWPFYQLQEYIENLDSELDDLYKKSDLRDTPDHQAISELYKEICCQKYSIKLS
jgi:hypothetical protein